MRWYVLFVETAREEEVDRWLRLYFSDDQISTLIPKRNLLEKKNGQFIKVTKKLFPGYIFLYIDMNIHKYKIIIDIPRLIRVLGSGSNYTPIDESEISVLLQLTGESSVIDYSKVFFMDSKAVFWDGPLCGMECLIKKINKHTKRATIQLSILGESRYLDVGIELLKPINQSVEL